MISEPIHRGGLVDDVIAPINVKRFAGDQAGGLAREERGGDARHPRSNASHRLGSSAVTED
jgi:hypothetical protein